jgi:hypothetical protein
MASKPTTDLGFLMGESFIGATQSLDANQLLSELKPWQIENGKAAFLDYLYELYERDNAEPGLRGTYIGLWEKFKEDNAQIMRASFISAQVTSQG